MIVNHRRAAMPDSYFDLVKKFPLTHIRDRRHNHLISNLPVWRVANEAAFSVRPGSREPS